MVFGAYWWVYSLANPSWASFLCFGTVFGMNLPSSSAERARKFLGRCVCLLFRVLGNDPFFMVLVRVNINRFASPYWGDGGMRF